MPVDPVCGIEMDESLALIHEHDGEKTIVLDSSNFFWFISK